ncbi:DNA polymerase III subunit beta [Candidatus Parcubacteria bacterium]|nr:DNA polymerase III subunit beta [Candidatus Parcubacteria bacterium]
MKTIILKENLKKGLDITEKITTKNLTLPILNNVLISTDNNLLNLITTDLEIAIKYWALSKIEKPGKIAIPAKLLSDFINFLPEEKINLEVKNNILHLDCKNQKAQIKGQDPEEFPIIPKIETKDYLEIKTTPFYEGISQVINFTTPNQTRVELSGIYFDFQKERLKITATDSFRLAEKTLYFENKINSDLISEKGYSFILPLKASRELLNIFSEKEGERAKKIDSKKIRIYFSSNQVLFEVLFPEISKPQIQLISRLIEGEYPDYQEIIPKKYETQLILNRNEFLNKIKTASLFSGKTNEIRLKAVPSKKEIEIFSQSSELGENKSSLSSKITGKEIKVSFNWRFLIEGLANIRSSEVIFEMNGEEGPSVLKPVGDATYLYVIMPIKAT